MSDDGLAAAAAAAEPYMLMVEARAAAPAPPMALSASAVVSRSKRPEGFAPTTAGRDAWRHTAQHNMACNKVGGQLKQGPCLHTTVRRKHGLVVQCLIRLHELRHEPWLVRAWAPAAPTCSFLSAWCLCLAAASCACLACCSFCLMRDDSCAHAFVAMSNTLLNSLLGATSMLLRSRSWISYRSKMPEMPPGSVAMSSSSQQMVPCQTMKQVVPCMHPPSTLARFVARCASVSVGAAVGSNA